MAERHGPDCMGPGRILWLASYPKSGNTWLRLFLANLRADRGTPTRLNDLSDRPMAAGRDLFEDATGLESSELTPEETRRLRPLVYAWLSDNARETITCKIHDAFAFDGEPVIDAKATFCAIYVVRNPLDVAVSFAHHLAVGFDAMIEKMSSNAFRIGGRGRRQLPQHLGSWSDHVAGWIDATAIPVLMVRYEDMSANPQATFERIATFTGMPTDVQRIAKAIEFSSFAEARRQEELGGFVERPAELAQFFRKGRVGGWRDELEPEQAARVIEQHRPMMERLGYAEDDGHTER